MTIRSLPLVCSLLLVACSGSDTSITSSSTKTSIPPVELGNRKSSLTPSAIENSVIREPEAWAALWHKRMAGSPPVPVPAVNFDQQMVIGIFLGGYPSSCYAIAIINLEQQGEQTWVTYQVNPPEPTEICAQAISYPLKLIAVPKKMGEVFFVDVSGK